MLYGMVRLARAQILSLGLVSTISNAGEPLLVPIPEVPPVYTPPEVEIEAQVEPQCTEYREAIEYTVSYIVDQCGHRLRNKGLVGLINRNNTCNEDRIFAKAYYIPGQCQTADCERSRVAEIRCERKGCNVCEREEYIAAWVADLSSNSRAVRRAAEHSLEGCNYRVTQRKTCVAIR